MSDLKMISPLLDHMTVTEEFPGHCGRTCFRLSHTDTGEKYILKRISIPESESQVDALTLTGAYPDKAAVNNYYGLVVEDIKQELAAGKKLAETECFVGALDYQVEAKESGVGYDVYILYPSYVTLADLISKGQMTHLRAVNMSLDLCDSISACRDAGYIFGNIKPENIYLNDHGKFLLGDLGLVSTQNLKFACLPQEYIGSYSAPELSDISAAPNTTDDLYSLGMVLFQIYNGNHAPFEDEEVSRAMADKLRITGKQLPTPIYADYELASIILRACTFKPEDRFQTPAELKQTLMLYMQRNEVSDNLIVPPITPPDAPVAAEEPEVEAEAVRMTDVQALDETFKESFAPDLTGGGTEKDVDPDKASAPASPPEASAETAAPPKESEEELVPPDQIDLDDLLASVDEAVGKTVAADIPAKGSPAPLTMQTEPAVPYPADRYVDASSGEAAQEEAQPEKKKVGPLIGKIFGIIALVGVIGVLVYFLLTWYFVDVKELRVESCTPDQAVVVLNSKDDLSKFVLSCTDNYGNSCVVVTEGDSYVIRGLKEKTTYAVTVNAAEYHRLTSASTYTVNFTTPEYTVVSDFTAARGEADGEVQLSFQYSGPAPTQWTVNCTDSTGFDSRDFTFDGNSYLVTDLTPYETYTFTLSAAEGFYPQGELSVEQEVLPIVTASGLNVSEINENHVTVSWDANQSSQVEWTVTCEADGIDAITKTTKQTSCTVDLPDLERDYTITVSAREMDEAVTLTLPANPVVVSNLKAAANEDGTVSVTWDTPAGQPQGKWILAYNALGSYHTPYYAELADDAEENVIVLSNLIPNTPYEVTLTTYDTTEQIFGMTTLNFKTDNVGTFDSYGLSPDAPLTNENGYANVYSLPEGEDWDYTDLGDAQDKFSPSDAIAVCVEADSIRSSRDDVSVMYVIRDSEGKAVNDVSRDGIEWSDLWYNRRHANAIPLPASGEGRSTPGTYTLEIYVNRLLLASVSFTIIE